MYNILHTVCCYANSRQWYTELLSIESICLVDYISNFVYLQLTTAPSNIIS